MVAKISVGNSLYGAIAYNGEKINEAHGRLLTTNRIYNDGSGTVDINKAMEGFLTFMPPQMKVEKPVVHISLNPHPDDVLTDVELQDIAREYLEKLGFGNQPYLVFKHEDIDRHHLHIVTVNVDENGKRLNRDFLYRRSDRIRRELEQKYGLHPAERKNQRLDNPLRKVDASAGDVKKQVGNTVKALNGQYRFQTMGEYRALLSLYNMTVEEARGNVRGREYHGLVYSVTDDRGNKVGNPFKSSLFGKSAGYEAVQKKFVRSKSEIKDRKLADMTKRTVLSVLQGTYGQGQVYFPAQREGHRHRAALHGGRAHLRGYLHRPPHGMRAERLAHGQGTVGECLAGTLHTAIRRTTADTVIYPCGCCGQGTRADRIRP